MIKRCFIGETYSPIGAPIMIYPITSNSHGAIPDLKSEKKDARTRHLGFICYQRQTNTWAYMLNSFAHQPESTRIASPKYHNFESCFENLQQDMKKRDYLTYKNAILMHEAIINEKDLLGEFKKAVRSANDLLATMPFHSVFLEYNPDNTNHRHFLPQSKPISIQIEADSKLSSGEAYHVNSVASIYTDEGGSFNFNPNGSMILVDGSGVSIFEINLSPEEGLYWENTY